MKENVLEKNLENLIIDGLIKEAEQDNADFENAMRNMSDEDFLELIYEPAYVSDTCDNTPEIQEEIWPDESIGGFSCGSVPPPRYSRSIALRSRPMAAQSRPALSEMIFDEEPSQMPVTPAPVSEVKPRKKAKSKLRLLGPWLAAAVVAVSVIMIVLIPSLNSMHARLCESALYASSQYISTSQSATTISELSDYELKNRLPELEERYREYIENGQSSSSYYDNLKEVGWDLTLAYLRLHRKGDAVSVLKVLGKEYSDTEFGIHCTKLLHLLE